MVRVKTFLAHRSTIDLVEQKQVQTMSFCVSKTDINSYFRLYTHGSTASFTTNQQQTFLY